VAGSTAIYICKGTISQFTLTQFTIKTSRNVLYLSTLPSILTVFHRAHFQFMFSVCTICVQCKQQCTTLIIWPHEHNFYPDLLNTFIIIYYFQVAS